jgi:hypothetical protein
MIRHFTSIHNVKNGRVIDPFKIKHAAVTALKISDLSGWVDPQTHLNIDFPKHLMRAVNVAEELTIGSKVILENERFMLAFVESRMYRRFGAVNEVERMEQLKEIYHRDFAKKIATNKVKRNG